MSVLNQSGEEQECPLCLEALEVDDLHFYPCTCGYQICRFCWNRIREMENGLCPACRKAYPENPADFTPLSQEQVAAIKTEKKAREQRRRNKTLESRRQLANVRVVQNNLVFVVGLPVRLADPEILKRQEYFGKYGKIHKVVINQSTTYAGSQGPSASAYVTYTSPSDALRAIQSVNNVTIDGRVLKGSLGTTKYCANFMKNQPCPKTDCMYLHELGDPNASFSKEEMHLGMHQVYERKLHERSLAQQQQQQQLANSSGTSTNGENKNSSKDKNPPGFIPTTIVTSSNINIVNSNSKCKKEQPSWSGSPSGGKEAWPSLGSSPPGSSNPGSSPPASDSSGAGSKQPSPKLRDSNGHTENTALSQENGTPPDRCSPTQQTQSKHKDKTTRNREQKNKANASKNTNANSTQEQTKWKETGSINEGSDDEVKTKETESAFKGLNNYELDEIESDRHSLLDNHDLLDRTEHSLLDNHDLLDSTEHNLLEDDSHSLLNDTNSDAVMMQRHREMLASLVDNNHMMGQMKTPIDSFGLMDGYDRSLSQCLLDHKEHILRERSREMLMRQNQLLRQNNKPYLPRTQHGLSLESPTEMLGTNYPTASMLTPFGVRLDGTVPGYMPPGRLVAPSQPSNMHHASNGFAEAQEGRYLGEHMDKFFTDFHKTQQLKFLLGKGGEGGSGAGGVTAGSGGFVDPQRLKYGQYAPPHNMMSAHQLEMEHKQRHQELIAAQNCLGSSGLLGNSGSLMGNSGSPMGNSGSSMGNTGSIMGNSGPLMGAQLGMGSSGPGMGGLMGAVQNKRPAAVDDDLDFDPFKETQKAFAEMMESEMQQNGLSPSESAERMRRSRLPPPGFSHMSSGLSSLGLGQHAQSYHQPHQDWTQMDPAIMSTSVNFPHKPSVVSSPPELFQRFSQLGLQPPQQNLNKLQLHLQQRAPINGQYHPHKLNWGVNTFPADQNQYTSLPLPPGFSDLAPTSGGAECIESK